VHRVSGSGFSAHQLGELPRHRVLFQLYPPRYPFGENILKGRKLGAADSTIPAAFRHQAMNFPLVKPVHPRRQPDRIQFPLLHVPE
jgi:hypothetical protein